MSQLAKTIIQHNGCHNYQQIPPVEVTVEIERSDYQKNFRRCVFLKMIQSKISKKDYREECKDEDVGIEEHTNLL